MDKVNESLPNQKKGSIITFWICIVLFIVLTIGVFTNYTNSIDQFMESFVLGIRNESLTNIMTIITNFGGAYALMAISVLLLIIKRNRKFSLLVVINLITVFLSSQILKIIIRRDRPLEIFLTNATGYSYPSGHTMVGSAFYIYLTYLICQSIKNKAIKILLYIITFILVLLIGFSRIYLGVHYTTDVMGGLILAIAHISLLTTIINNKKKGTA